MIAHTPISNCYSVALQDILMYFCTPLITIWPNVGLLDYLFSGLHGRSMRAGTFWVHCLISLPNTVLNSVMPKYFSSNEWKDDYIIEVMNVACTKTLSQFSALFYFSHQFTIFLSHTLKHKMQWNITLLPVTWRSAHWIKPHDALEYMDHWTNGLSPICWARNLTTNIGHFLHRDYWWGRALKNSRTQRRPPEILPRINGNDK